MRAVSWLVSGTFMFAIPLICAAAGGFQLLPATVDPSLPLKEVIGPTLNRDMTDGQQSASFQPILFNPGKTPVSFDKKKGYWKTQEKGQTYYFAKNNREWDPRVHPLAGPFTLDHYSFQWFDAAMEDFGMTDTSFVLEVKKNGKRHALYTQVLHGWSVSEDGKTLVLPNFVNRNGVWQKEFRIIDIASKRATNLPVAGCAESLSGDWIGGLLWTSSGDSTDACFWAPDGSLRARFHIEGGMNSVQAIVKKSGTTLLLVPPAEESVCKIALMPVAAPSKTRFISASKDICQIYAQVEWDTSGFTWEKPVLRYRVAPQYEDEYGMLQYGKFGPWKTLGK